MRRDRRAFVGSMGALAALVASGAGRARTPTVGQGRLFRITRRATPESYVFGTIHVADRRVSDVPAPVSDALERMRTLALELAPVQIADAQLYDLEIMDDGGRLEPLIGADAFGQLRYELFMAGTPERVIARLKPWAALLRISARRATDETRSLDENLLAAARGRRMSWMSLESIEEQVAAFDTIPLDSQVALLRHALAHRDALAAFTESSIGAWQRGDIAALAAPPADVGRRFPEMRPHYAQLARHIIVDRTALLHHRLFMPLRSGRVFAAVGASHLAGPEGLLAMLAADGYRASSVW